MNRRATFGAIVLAGLSLFGCGRKALPRPPEDVLPKTITDLQATETANGIELTWSRPRTYVDGGRMTDLGGFTIARASEADARAGFQRLTVIEVGDRERFRQTTRFRYVDESAAVGTQYHYQVVSFTTDRYVSGPSNIASVERTGRVHPGSTPHKDGSQSEAPHVRTPHPP
jgi:hypothetical protein